MRHANCLVKRYATPQSRDAATFFGLGRGDIWARYGTSASVFFGCASSLDVNLFDNVVPFMATVVALDCLVDVAEYYNVSSDLQRLHPQMWMQPASISLLAAEKALLQAALSDVKTTLVMKVSLVASIVLAVGGGSFSMIGIGGFSLSLGGMVYRYVYPSNAIQNKVDLLQKEIVAFQKTLPLKDRLLVECMNVGSDFLELISR